MRGGKSMYVKRLIEEQLKRIKSNKESILDRTKELKEDINNFESCLKELEKEEKELKEHLQQ
ncbi:hypothetical protein PDJ95_26910 [Bacillus cereus]|nr:hypothetical protein [Bacillus cereus]